MGVVTISVFATVSEVTLKTGLAVVQKHDFLLVSYCKYSSCTICELFDVECSSLFTITVVRYDIIICN